MKIQRLVLFPSNVVDRISAFAHVRNITFSDLLVEWINLGLSIFNVVGELEGSDVLHEEPYVQSRVIFLPEDLDTELQFLITGHPVNDLSDIIWRLIQRTYHSYDDISTVEYRAICKS